MDANLRRVTSIYVSNFNRIQVNIWVIPMKYIVERVCKDDDACGVLVNPLP